MKFNNSASNADSSQKTSVAIAFSIADSLSAQFIPKKLTGQRVGKQFDEAVEEFLKSTFPLLQPLRPGNWTIENIAGSRAEYQISKYEFYTHLAELASAIENDRNLASVLGNSYEISPEAETVS